MRNVLLSIGSLEKSTFTRFVVKAFLILVCALVLAIPVFFREVSNLFPGFEAYFHLSQGTVSYILSFLSYLLDVDVLLVARVLPVILGIFSLLVFFGILKRLGFKYWLILLASLILVFSPSFIFLFATLTDFSFVALLMLLICYLLLRKKEVPALVFFYVIPFFGLVNLSLASALLLFYSLSTRKFRLFLYALPSFAILLVSHSKNLFSFGSFISDFGGPFGLGIFIVILSFFGLRFFWRDKYMHFYFYVSLLILIVFSFFNLRILSYLNFCLALLSALGLELLFERHWRSKLIKFLTITIFVVGLFISGISYLAFVINELPNKDVVDGLYALRDMPNGVVFSHPSREYWIEFVGKSFTDGDALLYTRDIDKAMNIIIDESIFYIWIDKDMKSSVWVEGDQDLLFLLRYSKKFKNVYSNNYVEIWEVMRGVSE